jgi:hypothetical protein
MSFSSEVHDVVEKVEKQTGYPVRISPDTTLKVIATVTTATPTLPVHLVTYNPARHGVNYHIVFECGFLLRLFEIPADERCKFATTDYGQSLLESAMSPNKHLRRLGLDEEKIGQVAKQFFHGIMLQLRSVPPGMRVDQWIYDEYPALRFSQAESMLAQIADNLRALPPGVQKIAPAKVWAANSSMNAAYAMFFERLRGSYGQSIAYRSTGFEPTAETLLRILDDLPQEPTSDCRLVDAWADALQLSGWYKWIPFS